MHQKIIQLFPSIQESILQFFIRSCSSLSGQLINDAEFTLNKPYGLNHILIRTGNFGISLAQILPGQGTSFHFHEYRRELFYIKAGVLSLEKEEGVEQLVVMQTGTSLPFEKHALKNYDGQLLEVLEIFTPPLLDDKVRVQDLYNRKLGEVNHLE